MGLKSTVRSSGVCEAGRLEAKRQSNFSPALSLPRRTATIRAQLCLLAAKPTCSSPILQVLGKQRKSSLLGWSALHYAVQSGSLEMAGSFAKTKRLLLLGVYARYCQSQFGHGLNSSYMRCRRRNRPSMARLLCIWLWNWHVLCERLAHGRLGPDLARWTPGSKELLSGEFPRCNCSTRESSLGFKTRI